MIQRKKKLIFFQIILFTIGLSIIIYTYYFKKEKNSGIISLDNLEKVDNKLKESQGLGEDVFLNIKYSGLDLAGNRYILIAKEAVTNKINEELLDMKFVEVTFYFKDDTTLNVKSNAGLYNNKTLDMIFTGNVVAKYEGSKLTAQKADYSNSKSFLTISDNVIVTDDKGVIAADKLLFDIKKQNLKIVSINKKINANINLK